LKHKYDNVGSHH